MSLFRTPQLTFTSQVAPSSVWIFLFLFPQGIFRAFFSFEPSFPAPIVHRGPFFTQPLSPLFAFVAPLAFSNPGFFG